MKIVVLMHYTTHYYNLVLNRLCELGHEVVVVTRRQYNENVAGGGINQSRGNAKFRVVEMDEFTVGPYSSFKGLATFLYRERAKFVITPNTYLYLFVLSPAVRAVMWILGAKLLLKSIPFQVPRYQDAHRRMHSHSASMDRLPAPLRFIMVRLGGESLLRRLRAFANKVAFNRPNAHLIYTDEGRELYGTYGVPARKIFVTYNSSDTDLLARSEAAIQGLAPILPPSQHRILHVGRLVHWKRVDLLIRSLARLKPRFPDSELLVIGDGPELDSLRALAKELKVSDSVHFTGGVYEPELLARYFQSASVYVLAGMGGLSINDAMFFRLPIICSVCDGTEKKLVRDGENGKYFEAENEDDLVGKIEYVLADRDRRVKMGARSREIINHEVNIHTVIREYARAFDYLLTRGSV